MKILVVTYAYRNKWAGGTYRYFRCIAPILTKMGHELCFFDADDILDSQPGVVGGAFFVAKGVNSKRFARCFEMFRPDSVHIQAEIGIGVGARNFCVREKIPFSAAYHTHWDVLVKSFRLPFFWVWPYLRWLYKPASVIFTHTETIKKLLNNQGITNPIATFCPGVDRNQWFYESNAKELQGYARPYFITMSRISREKQIEDFLDLDLPGTKFVIGEGPYKSTLVKKYGDEVVFLPYDRARQYLSVSDVFVTASRFDTFNLCMLEALASGLPIAAYPVMGPIDVVKQGITGYTSENLQEAALACLDLKKSDCMESAKQYSWESTAKAFLEYQVRI